MISLCSEFPVSITNRVDQISKSICEYTATGFFCYIWLNKDQQICCQDPSRFRVPFLLHICICIILKRFSMLICIFAVHWGDAHGDYIYGLIEMGHNSQYYRPSGYVHKYGLHWCLQKVQQKCRSTANTVHNIYPWYKVMGKKDLSPKWNTFLFYFCLVLIYLWACLKDP